MTKEGDYIYSVQLGTSSLIIGRWQFYTIETSVPMCDFGASTSFRAAVRGKGTYSNHVYIANDEGIFDYDLSSPSTAPALMSISGMIDSDVFDVAFDEATERLWAGHDTGMSKINLGTSTADTYTVAGGELSGMSADQARILPGHLSVYNGRVVRGGGFLKAQYLPDAGFSTTERNAWVYDDNIPGYYVVSTSNEMAAACIDKTTGNVVIRREDEWESFDVIVTGAGTGTSSLADTQTARDLRQSDGRGVATQAVQLNATSFALVYGDSGASQGGFVDTYTVGTGVQTTQSIIGDAPLGFAYYRFFGMGRELMDIGNGVLMIPLGSYLIQPAYPSPVSFGWNGSAWVKNNTTARRIPKTGSHTLLDGVSVSFNNSVGDPWDNQFVQGERITCVYGNQPIKDNLQTYTIKGRYYPVISNNVTRSITLASTTYTIPECPTGTSPDTDFRDLDGNDLGISIYDNNFSGGADYMTRVDATPSAGEFVANTDGTIEFNAADVGHSLDLDYNYTLYM